MNVRISTTWSLRASALLAGIGLLAMDIIAGVSGALTSGAGTAQEIAHWDATSQQSFRWGIFGWLLVVMLDVVVAYALAEFFASVHTSIALLAGWFRLGYAAAFAVAISQLYAILSQPENLERTNDLLQNYRATWNIGLNLFAVHLILIGYLAIRARTIPLFVGILVGLAGVGYLFDGLGAILVQGYSLRVATFLFIGEVVLLFWLIIRGGKAQR